MAHEQRSASKHRALCCVCNSPIQLWGRLSETVSSPTLPISCEVNVDKFDAAVSRRFGPLGGRLEFPRVRNSVADLSGPMLPSRGVKVALLRSGKLRGMPLDALVRPYSVS